MTVARLPIPSDDSGNPGAERWDTPLGWRRWFDSTPIAMYLEDYACVAAELEQLRGRGIVELRKFLTENPEELERLIGCVEVVAANPRAVALAGAGSEARMLGRLPAELLDDGARASFITQFETIWRGGDEVVTELRGQTFGNRRIDCLLHWAAPVTDGRPDYSQVQVALLDITARVHAETTAVESAGRLATLYESTAAINASLDLDPMLGLVVEGARDLVGAGKVLLFLVDHEAREITHRLAIGVGQQELDEQTYEELEEGLTGWVWRNRIGAISEDVLDDERNTGRARTRADSDNRHWSIIVAPLMAADEAVFGTLTVLREAGVGGLLSDGEQLYIEMLAAQASAAIENARLYSGLRGTMEELQRTQASLLQAQKLEAVGQLAAGVAHEINTPIQFVSDNMRFLHDAVSDLTTVLESAARLAEVAGSTPDEIAAAAASHRQVLEEADAEFLIEEMPAAISQSLEGVDRVAVIVRALKEFSHPGGGALEPVDINRAIENTLAVARNEWKYVAEVETHLDPAVRSVPALPGPLNQVILNLLVNAAHAIGDVVGDSGELGKIVITTARGDQYCEIRIQDTGGGIPAEIQDRIFDPFFTTKEAGKGTGQGLAIAHDVVEVKHGGQLVFEVEPGVGTTFVIRIPLNRPGEGGSDE